MLMAVKGRAAPVVGRELHVSQKKMFPVTRLKNEEKDKKKTKKTLLALKCWAGAPECAFFVTHTVWSSEGGWGEVLKDAPVTGLKDSTAPTGDLWPVVGLFSSPVRGLLTLEKGRMSSSSKSMAKQRFTLFFKQKPSQSCATTTTYVPDCVDLSFPIFLTYETVLRNADFC